MATITSKGCSGSSLFSCGLFVSTRETLLPRGDDLQNKPFCSFDFRQLPKLGQLYQVYELNCRFITRGGAQWRANHPLPSPFFPREQHYSTLNFLNSKNIFGVCSKEFIIRS